jgi:serine/threonine protein kinase
MNYEELLIAKAGGKLNQSQMPIGEFFRAKTGNKYQSTVDIRDSLLSNITFCEGLKRECDENKTIGDKHQLHFTPVMQDNDIVRLAISEPGQYMSFAEMLNETPAVVAQRDFLKTVLEGLVSITTLLHKKGIRHLCFSPRTVFARKGDYSPMLLSHGSYYMSMSNLEEFYGDDAQYVAPEVLQHGTIDDRCDVYSLGKFLQGLCATSDMPFEYRSALKKATSELPEDRFNTPEELLNAVRKKHNVIRSAVIVAISCVAALVCVGLYFDMFPETNPVEFVKPVPRQPTDDLLDDGFDPAELGVTNSDSGDSLVFDEAAERTYTAKAEEIFRKKYAQEADRILSKIYNKEYMSNAEKKFTAESQSTIDELMKKQAELGNDAGLTPERSQLIATEIIDRITEQKKKEMGGSNSRAIQK